MGRTPRPNRRRHEADASRADEVAAERRGEATAGGITEASPAPQAASILRLQRAAGNAAVGALLAAHAGPSTQARALQRDAKPTPGVMVHPNSKLTAAQLAKLVRSDPNTPEWVTKGLGSSGSALVKSGPLKGPTDVIVDVSQSLRDAVTSGGWEVTTGSSTLNVTVTKPLSRGPKYRKTWSRSHDHPEYEYLEWRQVVTPALAPGEHLVSSLGKVGPGTTLTTPVAIHSEDPEILYGDTELAETTSEIAQAPKGQSRGLVVVVTEIKVVAPDGTTKTFTPTRDQIVESLLHELSAHAGQVSEGKPSEHGAGDVNVIADEIGGWFPASSTTGDIYDFIQHGADAALAKVSPPAIRKGP
ncbi:MAG TPA: hypothetical protein VGG07_21920 [Solirubrobacteraceae bacterium]|jgi:hypothetical protein